MLTELADLEQIAFFFKIVVVFLMQPAGAFLNEVAKEPENKTGEAH